MAGSLGEGGDLKTRFFMAYGSRFRLSGLQHITRDLLNCELCMVWGLGETMFDWAFCFLCFLAFVEVFSYSRDCLLLLGNKRKRKKLKMKLTLPRGVDLRLNLAYFCNFLFPNSGEGPFIINGSISSAAHFNLCSGSCPRGILCHYIGSWRSQGNVICL